MNVNKIASLQYQRQDRLHTCKIIERMFRWCSDTEEGSNLDSDTVLIGVDSTVEAVGAAGGEGNAIGSSTTCIGTGFLAMHIPHS
jgi:hypothetical protein